MFFIMKETQRPYLRTHRPLSNGRIASTGMGVDLIYWPVNEKCCSWVEGTTYRTCPLLWGPGAKPLVAIRYGVLYWLHTYYFLSSWAMPNLIKYVQILDMISLILIRWVEINGFAFFDLVNMKCTSVDCISKGVGWGKAYIYCYVYQ